MRDFSKIVIPIAVLCVAATLGLASMAIFVIFLGLFGIGDGLPFTYFQQLNLPILSVFLPVVGMILFLIALLGLFSKSISNIATEGSRLGSREDKKAADHRLKTA